MRERNPSAKHVKSMLRNYGHIHNYNAYVGTRKENGSSVKVYKCTRDDATTKHKK